MSDELRWDDLPAPPEPLKVPVAFVVDLLCKIGIKLVEVFDQPDQVMDVCVTIHRTADALAEIHAEWSDHILNLPIEGKGAMN